jgi:hypothetical protein
VAIASARGATARGSLPAESLASEAPPGDLTPAEPSECVVEIARYVTRRFQIYGNVYNQVRTHLALDKDAPEFRHRQRVGNIQELSLLGGLHHHYVKV